MKKPLCFLLILLLLMSLTVSVRAAENYAVLYGFSFDISSSAGGAVIHGYDDRSEDPVIPYSLLGAPIVRIDDYSFFNDAVITSVSFEQATELLSIGCGAFSGCSSLTEITLPSRTQLDFGSFQKCSSLQKITLGDQITEIPEQCFYKCTSLIEADIPASVTSIGQRAFADNTELRYVYLHDTVQSIADNAFDNDDKLIIRCDSPDSAVLQFAQDHHIPAEYAIQYLLGDTDGNGDVCIIDATYIQRLLADLESDPDGSCHLRGDVNGDGLTILDATSIQRYLASIGNLHQIGQITSGYIPVMDNQNVS